MPDFFEQSDFDLIQQYASNDYEESKHDEQGKIQESKQVPAPENLMQSPILEIPKYVKVKKQSVKLPFI